jgi:multidrug efflux pump subunit AcrA (membrane-fusion protein)
LDSDRSPYLETSPAPWAARGLAWVLIGLFAAVAVAAVVVHVPETVSSRFLLVPERGADQVRASRDGTVTEIRADEAQAIAKGQALFVIRSTAVGDRSAELRGLETQVQGATERLVNERRRHESQRLADDEEGTRLRTRLGSLSQKLEEQGGLRAARQERFRATLAIYENEIEITRREIEFRKQQYAIARELADRTERFHKEGIISWIENNTRQLEASRLASDLQQLERQLDTGRLKVSQLRSDEERQEIEFKVNMGQLTSERREVQAAMEKLRHETAGRRTAFLELERSLREDTQRNTIRTAALRGELEGSRGNEMSVMAPCAGTVLRLWAQRPGAVVKDGDPLADLACGGGRLQAELSVPPGEVGQVKPGQAVKLLYDAFPYQRHGVRRGTVRWVSPASAGVFFRAFADIEDETITVKGEPRPLTAGMGGRADVVIGRRALIAYAFEPLRQLKESLADAPPRSGGGAPESRDTGRRP